MRKRISDCTSVCVEGGGGGGELDWPMCIDVQMPVVLDESGLLHCIYCYIFFIGYCLVYSSLHYKNNNKNSITQ